MTQRSIALNRNKTFLQLSPADWITLFSLLMACLGLWATVHGRVSEAIMFMAFSMFTDMLDGLVARATGRESQFGAQLDSLVDVFVYLVTPMAILYRIGLQRPLSLLAIFAYFACGLLRLAHFNIVGTVEDEAHPGVAYHIGLPVIWSHLLVVLAFPLWHWFGPGIRPKLVVALFCMSAAMVSTLRFRKLSWYVPQGLIILAVAFVYQYLHAIGVDLP